MKNSIIFVYSYHHMNTQKICNVIAEKINAKVVNIENNTEAIQLENYNLVGFGAGIDSAKHYQQMLNFSEKLSGEQNKNAFIFSTSAIYSEKKMLKDHNSLRSILQNKGFKIVGEFSCPGFNTNSFLKYIGGMNKGRPNNDDLENAKEFAEKLFEKYTEI